MTRRRDRVGELLELLKKGGRWADDLADLVDVVDVSGLVGRARGDPRLPRGKTIEAFVESVEAWGVRVRRTWYQLVTNYLNQEPEQLEMLGEEEAA